MKARTLVLTCALVLSGVIPSLAQAPLMGTWTLNQAKSHMPAGTLATSTLVYETQGDTIKITNDGTTDTGQPIHTVWVGKFDGKDYPMTGDPTIDTRSYTLVDDHNVLFTSKKAGKVVYTGHVTVAPDGKSRATTTSGTAPDGNPYSYVRVHDKQ